MSLTTRSCLGRTYTHTSTPIHQQRKQWVQRSRSSLELAFVQGPLCIEPTAGDASDSQSDSSGSAPSICSSEGSENESTPQTSDSGSYPLDNQAIKQEESDSDEPVKSRALVPLTLRAANAARAPASRWLKRKQSFKLHLGPLNQRAPTRPRRRQDNGPEPSAQLLELFGDLLDARMESCLRITRLVRNSNRAMLHSI